MPTWFLPPDFTFTPEGSLRLGTVIAHPKRPTLVLASPETQTTPLVFPEVTSLIERNHTHSNSSSRSVGVELLARFVDVASASSKLDVSKERALEYSTVDHEVRSFNGPFLASTLAAIVELPQVRRHIDSGMFGKRPIYVITGHRVALDSFTVTKETGSGTAVELSASGPTGTVPVVAGAGFSTSGERKKADSYETAPGIIFAYRLHCIRSKRSGELEEELFAHPSAFLTGEYDEGLEAVEVTADMLTQDPEEEVMATEVAISNGEKCCYVQNG